MCPSAHKGWSACACVFRPYGTRMPNRKAYSAGLQCRVCSKRVEYQTRARSRRII